MSHRTPHAPVVYYARRDQLIKIGTTVTLRPRLLAQKIEELLAVEPGSYELEKQRHAQFADSQIVIKRQGKPNEWFVPNRRLLAHIEELRATHDLPDLARWEERQLSQENRAALALLPALVMSVRPLTLERFAAGLVIDSPQGCWLREVIDPTRNGYGRFYLEGKHRGAHTAAYMMFVGPVADGLEIDHMCHDPAECWGPGDDCPHRRCVNPAHLEPKSREDHALRAIKTYCKRGHLLTEETTYRSSAGVRQCMACSKEQNDERARRLGRGKCGDAQRARTHCKNGHEYTSENTKWIGPNGDMRRCRQCAEDRRLAEAERNSGKSPQQVFSEQSRKTHCPQGHPYEDGNLYITKSGSPVCRKCRAASQLRYLTRRQERKLGGPGVEQLPGVEPRPVLRAEAGRP